MLSLFEVVAEPSRRKILDLLRKNDRAVNDLAETLGLAQPAVSKHLKVLRDAGLVTAAIDAQRRMYRLRAEPLRELDAWVAPYRRHWAHHLDALEAHLATRPDEPTPTPAPKATPTKRKKR